MKHKRGLLILLLIFLIVAFIPPSKAATAPVKYKGKISYQSNTFKVAVSCTLDISCSDNWRYWPGLTSDTLTAKLTADSLTLDKDEKILNYDKIIGEMDRQHFKTKRWSEWNLYNNPWTGEGYYELDSYRREYYAHLEGQAFGLIEYTGGIAPTSPNTLNWTGSASQTVKIHTMPALLGSATIKVRVVEYRLKIKISTITYKNDDIQKSDPGKWSSWFTIGDTPSDYAELEMTNMGVSLSIVVSVAIAIAVIVFLFITKRHVEIVSPEENETGRLLVPSKEKGPPTEELEPFTEELDTPTEELGLPRELEGI